MQDTHVRISEALHEKMKIITKQTGRNIKEEYDKAIAEYIERFEQERILSDSALEDLLEEKITRTDKHLSSMLGKNSLDTSMILIGLLYFLEYYYEKDIQDIFETIRRDGVNYYTNKNTELKRNDDKEIGKRFNKSIENESDY